MASQSKGKEKKQRRKEEAALDAARRSRVAVAQEIVDPLEAFVPFRTYNRKGIHVELTWRHSESLSSAERVWGFTLLKTHMQALYEEADGWGWHEQRKRRELFEESARFLWVTDQESKEPRAFAHVRFEVEDNVEVLYLYEIHADACVRRKGLGRFMMSLLELIARRHGMKKLMLTVFKANTAAMQFYMDRLKYSIDATSPTFTAPHEDFPYEILSKRFEL